MLLFSVLLCFTLGGEKGGDFGNKVTRAEKPRWEIGEKKRMNLEGRGVGVEMREEQGFERER
jgi:hypothetical protein